MENTTNHVEEIEFLKKELNYYKQLAEDYKTHCRYYNSIINEIPTLIWSCDEESRNNFVNKGWLDFTGREYEDELGYGWVENIHPEDLDYCIHNFIEAFKSRQIFSLEYRLRRGDGVYRWVIDSRVPRLDENNVFQGYIGCITDITDKKESELKVKFTQEMLQEAQELANIGNWSVYYDSNIVYWSEQLYRILGLELQSVKPSMDTYIHYIYPADKRLFDIAVEKVEVKDFVKIQKRILNAKNELRYTEVTIKPLFDKEGKRVGIFGTTRDTTEQVESEKKLRETELYYKTLIETSNTGFALVDAQSNVVDANHEYVRIAGLTSKEEIIGRNEREWTADEYKDIQEAEIKKCLANGYIRGLEVDYVNSKGDIIPVEINGSVMHFDHGSYILKICRDITERKEAQEILNDSLHEKQILLKEIHHRVKNNLAVISGLLELQSHYINNTEVKSVLIESTRRIKSMALIHEKLYLTDSLSNVDFALYIEDLIHSIKKSYVNPEVEVEINTTIKDVRLDIVKAVPCGLLLNEIITNSFKHAFSGMKKGNIDIDFYKDDVYCLKVKDNGCGIPEDYNYKKAKTLGFTLINALAKQLNGQLEIINDKGLSIEIRFN